MTQQKKQKFGLQDIAAQIKRRPYSRVSQERMLAAKKFAWNCTLNNILFPAGEEEEFSLQDLCAASSAERAELLDAFDRAVPARSAGEESQVLFKSRRYILMYRDAQTHLETICQILDSAEEPEDNLDM